MTRGRSFIVNPAKSTMLGDGVYIRRYHSVDGAGVELGVRNGDNEFMQVLLSPHVIEAMLNYLYIDGFSQHSEIPTTQPPADERAA